MRGKKLTLLLAGCLGLTLMAGCGKSGNPAEALKERYSQYVDLGTYKGIKYTPTETPVTSEDVDAQVNQLVTQNGKKVEKKAGTAMTGDTVNIAYMDKEADFVVRNPTHVACALKYDAQTMMSPTVLMKGAELIAQEIIRIAEENNVPIVDNPPVARALYRMVEVGQQIPPELFKAVAEILLFVYNLKNKQNQGNIK